MLDALLHPSLQLKALTAVVLLAFLGNAVKAHLGARSRLPLPPGPPRHWLFGNALPKEK